MNCDGKACGSKLNDRIGYVVRDGKNFCLTCYIYEAVTLYPEHLRIVAGLQKHIDKQNEVIGKYKRQAEALRLD